MKVLTEHKVYRLQSGSITNSFWTIRREFIPKSFKKFIDKKGANDKGWKRDEEADFYSRYGTKVTLAEKVSLSRVYYKVNFSCEARYYRKTYVDMLVKVGGKEIYCGPRGALIFKNGEKFVGAVAETHLSSILRTP